MLENLLTKIKNFGRIDTATHVYDPSRKERITVKVNGLAGDEKTALIRIQNFYNMNTEFFHQLPEVAKMGVDTKEMVKELIIDDLESVGLKVNQIEFAL